MSPKLEEVWTQAMALSNDDRIELAEELLKSVAEFAAPDIEEAWIAESARRFEAYLAGETTAIPAEEVFRQVRSKLA